MSGEILTPKEVAAILKCSPATVNRMCDRGELAGAARIGVRFWRIPRSAIEAYFTPRSSTSSSTPATSPASADAARALATQIPVTTSARGRRRR